MDNIMDLSIMWKTARDVFPYFERVPDWDDTYREFLPKAAAAKPGLESRMLYAQFMATLGDGHTSFIFPRSFAQEAGQLPFDLLYTSQGYLINVCPAGWERQLYAQVLSVNCCPLADLLQELFGYCYHVGDYIPAWQLRRVLPALLPEHNVIETTAGRAEFSLHADAGEMLCPDAPQARWKHRKIGAGRLDIRLYEGNILYAALPDCQYAKAAQEIAAAGAVNDVSGVILDLRENIGGMTKYGGEVAELFISGQFSGCRKWTRQSKGIDIACGSQFAMMSPEELQALDDGEAARRCMDALRGMAFEEYTDCYGSPDHRAAFEQPCVVLTSRRTVSAAEDTVAFFKSNHRATILGEATSGTTGTPCIVPLSQGSVRVCSVGYRLLDGTEFVGCGIQPDIEIVTAAEDLSNGIDAQLEAALHHLSQSS